MTADDFRWAEKQAREQGLEILGFYHSHPDHTARPSEFDREHALPWYSCVVLRVGRGVPQETTSWVLSDDRSQFLREEVLPPLAAETAAAESNRERQG